MHQCLKVSGVVSSATFFKTQCPTCFPISYFSRLLSDLSAPDVYATNWHLSPLLHNKATVLLRVTAEILIFSA